jgi:thiopeptide-type bacteriocin biosynthesis protein
MLVTDPNIAELRLALAQRIAAVLDGDDALLPLEDGVRGHLLECLGNAVGRTVIESLAGQRWSYFRIGLEPARARHLLVRELAPMLRDVARTNAIDGWWWLFKTDVRGPAIRLRLFARRDAIARVEDDVRSRLAAHGYEFSMPRYEPELLLFGGPHGMRLAHELFCADSAFLSAWAEREGKDTGALIPEALSLALTMRMLEAAGLDVFERWDVFHAVAMKRAFASTADRRFAPYEQLAHRVLTAGHDKVLALYASEGHPELVAHLAFIDAFGPRLSASYFDGLLECGRRELCVPLVLFHWNRLLLSPFAHFGLSHAMTQEYQRVIRQDPHHASVQDQ